MSKRPKTSSKYRFEPVDSLASSNVSSTKLSVLKTIEIPQNDASALLKSNKEGTKQKSRKIGELDDDFDMEAPVSNSIALSQETEQARQLKKARIISSDDSAMFWKASPRQKRVKQVCSSPSKADDVSSLNDESLSDIFHVDLSPEKFKNQPSNSSNDIQPNNLNQSILLSLKTIKETTKPQGNDRSNASTVLDNNFSNLLNQIGTSMLLPEQTENQAQHMQTIFDSTNIFNETNTTTEKHDTIESDEFSDDGDNDNLILQLTQRPAIREKATTLMTKDTEDDIFSDDIIENRSTLRISTEATDDQNIETDDSFSDDDDIPLVSKMNSFTLNYSDENLAKCAINNPLLHRFQIKEINVDFYKIQSATKEQKVLKCMNSNDTFTTIIVRDFWVDLDFKPLDIIHIVTDNESDDFSLVDKEHNLLIWHPDELVSPTKIGSATYCVREAIINDRFKGPGVVSEALIIGNITHSLFQSCLQHNKIDDEYIEAFINQKLKENVLNIYSVESSVDDIKEIILTNAVYIKSWIELYVSKKTINSEFSVSNVLDIEENIMSPMFGLRGFIDVVIETGLPTGKYVVPMEIKSGKEYLSNKAQVAMYTLLIKDRYQVNSKLTDLVYTKLKLNHLNEIKLTDLKHLIQLRNSLSQYMIYGQTSFPPLKQRSSCERCFSLEPCMVLDKLVDNGTAENSGIDIDMYCTFTDHIDKQIYSEFFEHWNSLITKEEGFLKFRKSDLWKYTSEQREIDGGNCIGRLKLSKCEYSSHSRQYVYEFKREPNGIISKIAKSDSVILSENDGGKVGLADCIVKYIDAESIIVASKRRWIDSTVKELGFNADNNQKFKSVLNQNPIVIPPSVTDKAFRIDKNVFAMGLGTARWNLLNLFLPSGDAKRRELIVDLREPVFGSPQWKEDCQDFNADQRRALDIVSRTEDYSLILGMPGTGKTTVISQMIKSMIENGKSVLITSYTHSAVDNICEKLIDTLGPDISLLRLGSPHKIHSKVQPYSLYSDEFIGDLSSKESFEEITGTRKIIATTCLGVTEGIFNREFDYCIVDEASQVALPIVLGPIQYAEKFVLVGDHFQLPPLVVNPDAKAGGLDKSLFQLLNDAYPQHVVELTNQYRMNEDIMTISNELIYDGRLKCGTEDVAKSELLVQCPAECSEWIREVMKPVRKVTFVDYDGLDSIREYKNGDQIENPGECELISQLIETMIDSGVNVKDIGLMSFYNGQLMRFRRKLPVHLVKQLEMLTADKFQGRDKDVIIISLVRTEGIGSLLKEMSRVNVAMTRAKKKLVVFGHGGLIRKEVPLMMRAFESRNWVITPDEVKLDDQDSFSTSSPRRGKSQIKMKFKGDILNMVMEEMKG